MFKKLKAFLKAVVTPRFKDLPYARKECTRCGIIFDQYQMRGENGCWRGSTWYEPATYPKKDIPCDCEQIMTRNKPRTAY